MMQPHTHTHTYKVGRNGKCILFLQLQHDDPKSPGALFFCSTSFSTIRSDAVFAGHQTAAVTSSFCREQLVRVVVLTLSLR